MPHYIIIGLIVVVGSLTLDLILSLFDPLTTPEYIFWIVEIGFPCVITAIVVRYYLINIIWGDEDSEGSDKDKHS